MRVPTLATAAFFGAANAAISATAVRSSTPFSCSAVGGTLVTFADDMSAMRASFPDLNLYVDTPSHGFPPSYSIMYCITEVEYTEADFGTGTDQARFAISSVTWSTDNLTLEAGDNFNQLTAKIDLNIEVTNETSPVHYPIGKDRWSSNLVSERWFSVFWSVRMKNVSDKLPPVAKLQVNLDVNPAIGVDEPYAGKFTFTAKNPNPVVSIPGNSLLLSASPYS